MNFNKSQNISCRDLKIVPILRSCAVVFTPENTKLSITSPQKYKVKYFSPKKMMLGSRTPLSLRRFVDS